MNNTNEDRIAALLMQISMGERTIKKLAKEREMIEKALFDLCNQQAAIKGLELKFIELDAPTFNEKELDIGKNEIPIYKINQMSNYDELFQRLGQEANPKIYNQFKNIESMHQKKLAKVRKDVREYEQLSGKKYNLNF